MRLRKATTRERSVRMRERIPNAHRSKRFALERSAHSAHDRHCADKIEFNFLNGNLMVPAGPLFIFNCDRDAEERSRIMARKADTREINVELADVPGTSLKVSPVAIGTWAIGGWMWGGTDEAQSVSTIRAALEHGINIIDT